MTKRKKIILAAIAIFAILALYPYESVVVPAWRVVVVDESGTACQNMPVSESWGDYSLFIVWNSESEDSVTDAEGFVTFPERRVRASGIRRIIVPFITKALTLAHGSYGVHASFHVNGLKDVAWLSYKGKAPLPDTANVKKCLTLHDLY